MTETIVWGVLWLVFIPLGFYVALFGGIGLGVLIAAASDKEWPAVVGVVVGWLGGIAWGIFAAVQVVLHIIAIIQLASA